MKVEIQIDSTCSEPQLLIRTSAVTEEIRQLIQIVSECRPQTLLCYAGQEAVLVEQDDLIRIYTAGKKVYAQTDQGDFLLKKRLYELEERLDKTKFVRISNGEIVSLRQIQRLDFSMTGTIGMRLKNGETVYVSRRYLPRMKKILQL